MEGKEFADQGLKKYDIHIFSDSTIAIPNARGRAYNLQNDLEDQITPHELVLLEH